MSAIPNFAEVPLRANVGVPAAADGSGLKAVVDSEVQTRRGLQLDNIWQTPEQIPVKPVYTAADVEGVDHLDTMPGLPPFVRGPYATMYVQRPWTVRQYAGFSTAKESNAFYR